MNRCVCCLLVLGILSGGSAAAADLPAGPGDWPQWRGPARDGVSRETGLARQWPSQGPAVVWQVETVGVGYSSLAIKDGRIITLGDLDGVEHVIALDASDGSLQWAVQPEPVAQALEEQIESEMHRLDANSDGVVDEAEALAGLGPRFYNFDLRGGDDPAATAIDRAKRLLTSLDADGDGLLSFAEAGSRLQDAFARIDAADEDADVAALAARRTEALFAAADADRDGQLSEREARGTWASPMFRRIDQRDAATNTADGVLTREEVDAYLARFEPGRDGWISGTELAEFFHQQYPGRDGLLASQELRGLYGGLRNNQGDGPRSTPTIDGERVYVEGGNGDVSCLETATGKTIWHVSLTKDFGGSRPGWGYSESPLIEGELVIVTPGGNQGTIMALDKHNGRLVWRSDDVRQQAHYSSPVAADIGGVRQIIQFARESMFGVTAAAGELLWSYSKANNRTANCTTPVVFDNHVFATSAYGTGGGLARIEGQGKEQRAEEVYFERRMANHHGGVVRVSEWLYGFGDRGLIAMHLLTGEIAWTARSVGKGSLVYADSMLYCLGERHEMALVEATPAEYRERGRFAIDNLGRPSWAHPVVAGGRLYIRNQQRLTAYDVSDK